jgi:hypothetical protein
MKYGALHQDDYVIDIDDELDIVEFPTDSASNNAGDIENQIKNIEHTLVETPVHPSPVHDEPEPVHDEPEPVHNSPALASFDQYNKANTTLIVRSPTHTHTPLVMTICSNIELTVPQMVTLFISIVFLEYFILLLITR